MNKALEGGLPKGFTGLRALQQPKQSEHAGVNWDKHTKKWLARVYEPMVGGRKGKEHKVGYFDCDDEAHGASHEAQGAGHPGAAAPEGEEEGEEGIVAKGAGEPSPPGGDPGETGGHEDTGGHSERRLNDELPPENEAEDNLGAGTVAGPRSRVPIRR